MEETEENKHAQDLLSSWWMDVTELIELEEEILVVRDSS